MKKFVVGLTLANLIANITGIGDRRHDFQHELQRFKPKTVHHQEGVFSLSSLNSSAINNLRILLQLYLFVSIEPAPPPPPDSLLPDEHPQVAEPGECFASRNSKLSAHSRYLQSWQSAHRLLK